MKIPGTRWYQLPLCCTLAGAALVLWSGRALLAGDGPGLILLSAAALLLTAFGAYHAICALPERLSRLRPHLPLLFCSIFLLNHLLRHGIPEPGWLQRTALALQFLQYLLLAGLLPLLLREYYAERRPWSAGTFRRLFFVLAVLLALFGITEGSIFLIPLFVGPLMHWLRSPALLRSLRWYAPLMLAIVLHGVLQVLGTDMQITTATVSYSIGEGSARTLAPVPPAGAGLLLESFGLLEAWGGLWFQMAALLSLIVLAGRFLHHARIPWKLTANALLGSLLPILLLALLFSTLVVVLIGGYRAGLVRTQLVERLEVARVVTTWFAEAWSDPLDRQARSRFEEQISSLAAEGYLSKIFFSIYWPVEEGESGASVAFDDSGEGISAVPEDSLETWRRIVSTWRMPSDFPLDFVRLKREWKHGEDTGLVHAGQALYLVAMVERAGLLALGFIPFDQEELEAMGAVLGTGLKVQEVAVGDDFIHYAVERVGLRTPVESRELCVTPDFPDADDSFLQRLFTVGMARVDNEDFPLDDPGQALLAHVEVLPGRLFPEVFGNERIVSFPYLALMVLQALVLVPLLLGAAWVAWLLNWRISRSIAELRQGTQRLSRGELDYRIPVKTTDELGMLASSFNLMSERIRRNMEELAEKERMERELSIARNIQEGLLPDRLPEFPLLDIACTCRMALEVGGDYYDFLVTPAGELALALGDVSGKGVAAALLMSNLQASWRTLAGESRNPGQLNRRLNEQLAASTSDEMFATFIHGTLSIGNDGTAKEEPTVRFRYSNAGHNPPLLVRNARLTALESGGLALGMFPGMEYRSEAVELVPGDWLVIYTDGLTEALNTRQEEFSEGRLRGILGEPLPGDAEGLLRMLLEQVASFEQGAGRSDDLTLLVLRYPEEPARP